MPDGPPLITLLTDFGENGTYVGAMKGVMLGIVPGATLVDISHQVSPQDIQQAASILAGVYAYYPAHTVHLIVVDPGVGSTRRAIAMQTGRGLFVAPDNGVLSYVQRAEPDARVVVLENSQYWRPNPSHTFHGRDIFSPAAAHLAAGVPLQELGSPCDDAVQLPVPPLEVGAGFVRGEIVRIDHFGNALTNITELQWLDEDTVELVPPHAAPLRFDARRARVMFGWHTLSGMHQTYSRVSIGQALVLVGSSGELEISVNQGRAEEKLGIKVGDPVTLYLP